MCLRLFCGADVPIPLLPWTEETNPPLSIASLSEEDKKVKINLSQKYVYEFTNYGGCWCSFLPESTGFLARWMKKRWPDRPEKAEHNRLTLEALAQVLKEPSSRGSVKLWSCWYSEESSEPRVNRSLHLQELKVNDFRFGLGEMLQILPDSASKT